MKVYNILQIPSLTEIQIRDIMENIIQKENINIDDESREYLLKISGRSIRNVINNLEKIFIITVEPGTTNKPITIDMCKNICSNISFLQFEFFLETLFDNKLHEAIQILQDIFDYGYSVIDILDYLFTFMKNTPILTEEQKYKMIPIICKYITIFHNVHEESIELAMFTNEIYGILEK